MLKTVFCLTLSLIFAGTTLAQRDLTPNSRRKAFGKRDFRNLSNTGLQFSFGPTYQFTRSVNKTYQSDVLLNGNRFRYTHDPGGRIGVFAELGMAHFPPGNPKFGLKKRIISYFDWGLGFKLLGGTEQTIIDYTDASGNILSSETGQGKYYNGYAYGRITAHNYFNITKGVFIDNGLGLNLDYRVLENRDYEAPVLPETQYFHKNFVAQIHYDFGIGFRLKRGSYIIPGLQIPIVGIYEWNNFNPALRWYSSGYWPVMFHIKFIRLFEKRAKGCPAVETNDADRQRDKEYRQGN